MIHWTIFSPNIDVQPKDSEKSIISGERKQILLYSSTLVNLQGSPSRSVLLFAEWRVKVSEDFEGDCIFVRR